MTLDPKALDALREQAARERLINAAPALLAACREALDYIGAPHVDRMCHRGICPMEDCARCRRAQQIIAAIAMAEGSAP